MSTKQPVIDSSTSQVEVVSKNDTQTSQEATWRAVEVLLRQNAALEREVERLVRELDQHSMGVQKKGYLYKWREKEIYFAPKWGLRYFVLQGNQLSYYGDEDERRPRRTIDLSRCFVRDDGAKKGGLYHVFSIYLEGNETTESSLLIRLSAETAADAAMWIDKLEQACAINESETSQETSEEANHDSTTPPEETDAEPSESPPLTKQPSLLHYIDHDHDHENDLSKKELHLDALPNASLDEVNKDARHGSNWEENPLDLDSADFDTKLLPPAMLQRVQSASLVLQKSMSRLSNRILSHAKMPSFTISGSHLSRLVDVRAEKKPKEQRVLRSFPAYKPMHLHAVPSPLSNECRPGEYSYRGFFNLGAIILIVTHCDLIITNMNRYGFKFTLEYLLKPPEAVIPAGDATFELPALLMHGTKAVLTLWISLFLNFALEKCALKYDMRERTVLQLNILISLFNLIVPCYWVWTSKLHPGVNMLYLFQSLITWMKLISYAHANKDLRVANRKANKKLERDVSGYSSNDDLGSEIPLSPTSRNNSRLLRSLAEVKDIEPPVLFYPDNITFINLLYFMVVPTLCYQLNYPRTESIRWKKVGFLLFRMAFVSVALWFSIEQYIKPTLEGVVAPMESGNVLLIIERLLMLSIPNTYVWLLVFYLYFHVWLNLLAELTRFGDRLFYKDWWNAKTIDRYW
eukprot:scaffold15944_cov248-Ochromonas_danica.AAC.9